MIVFSRFVWIGALFLLATAFFLYAASPWLTNFRPVNRLPGPRPASPFESLMPWSSPDILDSIAAFSVGAASVAIGIWILVGVGRVQVRDNYNLVGVGIVLFGVVMGSGTTYLILNQRYRSELKAATVSVNQQLEICTEAYVNVREELDALKPPKGSVPPRID